MCETVHSLSESMGNVLPITFNTLNLFECNWFLEVFHFFSFVMFGSVCWFFLSILFHGRIWSFILFMYSIILWNSFSLSATLRLSFSPVVVVVVLHKDLVFAVVDRCIVHVRAYNLQIKQNSQKHKILVWLGSSCAESYMSARRFGNKRELYENIWEWKND